MPIVTGTFEVSMSPLESAAQTGGDSLGRLALAKSFAGPLEATSVGQMVTAMGEAEGSAGYVAMEVVAGSLDGRHGTFVLQHFGVMDRGEPTLTVSVVPDSGSGDLAGLSGSMTIENDDGAHSYEFDYEIRAE